MNDKSDQEASGVHQKVRVVFEDDVEILIRKLGVQDEVEQGKILCSECSQRITYANIGVIYKREGQLRIACNEPACMSATSPESDR